MRKGIVSSVIMFITGLISLIIVMRSFWNVGVFVDAHNTSPAEVYGGDFWNWMQWALMPLLLLIVLLSAFQIVKSFLK